jgi:hypothetical protein
MPYLSDLYESVTIENAVLNGLGKSKVTHIGKAKYIYIDDKGHEITIDDHDVLVCPGLPTRIVSIPNWATQLKKLHGPQDKTRVTSYGDITYIYTNRDRSKRTIAHHDEQGIPIMPARLAEDVSYSTYCACFPCYNMNVVSDNEDSDYHVHDGRRNKRLRDRPSTPTPGRAKPTSFSTMGSNPHTIPEEIDPKDLFMAYHIRLGHLPFDRIQMAAKQGLLPSRIANCHVPKCASCLFGPWRTHGHIGHISRTATKPGDVVSVDQLISKTPGLVAQSTGILMKRRHSVATIFVDQASGIDIVYPQESTSAKDTLAAKQAFERFAKQHNVTIKHYHCDNGIFASKKFRAAVDTASQTMTFCGVNAHHQNGVAERRIQDLADRTRSMLVNARHRNPFATDHFWPFALRLASEIDRTIPKRSNTKSPLELFTGVAVRPKTNHFRPFGCPVYVLNAPLQAGKSQPKWQDRSRVGCYLDCSSQHATSVSLILHPRTGHVSPQFTSRPCPIWAASQRSGPSTRNYLLPSSTTTPTPISPPVWTPPGSSPMMLTMTSPPIRQIPLPRPRRTLTTAIISLPRIICTTTLHLIHTHHPISIPTRKRGRPG